MSSAYEDLTAILAKTPSGQSVTILKEVMPALPPEFRETVMGTPLSIAHPGSVAQYRAGIHHAYKMSDSWKIHRDGFDPARNPLEHVFNEAPEVPIAFAAAIGAGAITYHVFDRLEKQKDEGDRRNWFPILMGIIAAVVFGLLVYLLGAGLRVGLA